MARILYYSTNLKSEKISFRDALLKGLASDRGLFMPESIPSLSSQEIASFKNIPYHDIAFLVLHKFLHSEISDRDLNNLTHDAYNYDVPVENIYERKYVMRLDRGPTASFKDFAARMMGRLMQHFLQEENKKLFILTATSGDTGSAIANAFYGLENIRVVILYPEKEVTDRQRKQMTTLNKNIHVVALNGKFDDCQAMVKKAFSDPDHAGMNLSSANSINIGRLLPQSIYYIYACSLLCDITKKESIIFSVPSGNFGNLMGGLIAKHMGLPVKRFIVSTNENDEVPRYFTEGFYQPVSPSIHCISSAMNVGHPSNLARVVALYGGIMDETGKVTQKPDLERMKIDMYPVRIDDDETRNTLRKIYNRHKILLEPHGSVGWAGLMHYFENTPKDAHPDQVSVCLETAHPAKFPDEFKELLNLDPELPASLTGLDNKAESYERLENNYSIFKQYLKDNYKL